MAILLVVAMMLAMLPGFAAAQIGGDYYPLYAGQDWQVGNVEVWNDGDNLYVKYLLDEDGVTDEGWYLTEVHLHVGDGALDPLQFPLNGKDKSNPSPGHFDHTAYFEYEAMTTDHEFVVPLSDLAGFGSPLQIAAHAVVTDCNEDTYTPELTWMRSTERTSAEVNPVAYFPGLGTQWTKQEAFNIALDPSQKVWDNGTYHFVAGVTTPSYASWKYAYNWGNSYDGYSDLRRFNATFSLPAGYEVLSGTLTSAGGFAGIPINDNVFLFLNEELLFWGGTRVSDSTVPDTFLGVDGVQALRGAVEPKETDRWYIPGTFPAVEGFVAGTNALDVFAEENQSWGGMGELVLALDYRTWEHESAWAGDMRFNDDKGNWATYFEYELEPYLVRTLQVSSDGTAVGSMVLSDGITYIVEAVGTYRFVNWTNAGIADAAYSLRIPGSYNDTGEIAWISGSALPAPYTSYLEVWVDGVPVDWDDDDIVNLDHTYDTLVTGDESPLTFRILDNAYGDNSGSITINIYQIP